MRPRPASSAALRALRGRPAAHRLIEESLAHWDDAPDRSGPAALIGVHPLPGAGPLAYDAAVREIALGDRLARLGDGFTLLHSVPLAEGGPDAEHIVVSAAGVHVLTAARRRRGPAWSDASGIAGVGVSDLARAEAAADAVRLRLAPAVGHDLPVSAVVVVPDGTAPARTRPMSVSVVPLGAVVDWLVSRPAAVPDAEAALVARRVANPGMWAPVPELSAAELMRQSERFARLRALADDADRRWRITSRVLGFGGLGAAAVSGVSIWQLVLLLAA